MGERIVIFGGASDFSKKVFGNVDLFDPATRSWKELPPLPTPRKSSASAIVGDGLYVIGGHTDDTYRTGGSVNERAKLP